MIEAVLNEIHLDKACGEAAPAADHAALLAAVRELLPDLAFRHALTRSGWHRIGGVVTADLGRVATNLRQWAETESDHDMFALYEDYADSGYLTTRFDGRTHYFVAPTGARAPDFFQLEVEELVEVVDRPLFVDDEMPDDIEEFLDPPGAIEARVEPQALAAPRYIYRAITDIDDLVADQVTSEGSDLRYIRFLEEWDRSSAGGRERFCDHFVLRLLPFRDRFGEHKIEATPLPIDPLPAADPAAAAMSGAALANFLQGYDAAAGFPMAWYFAMLIRKKAMADTAQPVWLDYGRNYRYLPERDLPILKGWMRKPYSF